MEHDYNFWADLLSTFRSCNDWIKGLIVVTPWAALAVCYVARVWARMASKTQQDRSPPHQGNAAPVIEHAAELRLLTESARAGR